MFAQGWLKWSMASALSLLNLGMVAEADVVNPSFENDVLVTDTWAYQANGWNITGDAGTFHPSTAAYPGSAPHGNNVGFVQSGWGRPTGVLEQITDVVLEPGMVLELHAMIGRRVDNPLVPWGGYVMSMYAGDIMLAQDMTGSQPGAGMFAPASLLFTVNDGVDGMAQLLKIRFEALYGQTNIDQVRLLVSPTPGSIVLVVIGAVAFGSSRQRLVSSRAV